jgi:tetratricopeptide (TPR) repeat protein
MIKQVQLFLGPARVRAFILLLSITGLVSLILNTIVNQYDWVRTVQSLLALVFILGSVIIFGGRLNREEQMRWAAILGPAIGALLLAMFILPNLALPLLGAALGWIVAAVFIFRGRTRMEYQRAIKHLRKQEYADAVKVMDELIKVEPDQPNHYRFRADILRLWGKLGPARRDYKKMVELAPESAVAYNGLAEVCLQAGDYAEAKQAGLKALELAPEEWVAAYNLGMIEDRLGESKAAIEHLQAALQFKVPDVRHRLLIYLYLARAYNRLGDTTSASAQVEALKSQRSGLEEWQTILVSDMATVLRTVLAEDIQTAHDLIDGKIDLAVLGTRKTK